MVGMSSEMDADGDVVMSYPRPIYESVRAPRINSWDQESLLKWHRHRKQYEAQIQERCIVTGETYEHVVASVKSTTDPFILAHVAKYVMNKTEAEVVDKDIIEEIEKKIRTMRNAYVP